MDVHNKITIKTEHEELDIIEYDERWHQLCDNIQIEFTTANEVCPEEIEWCIENEMRLLVKQQKEHSEVISYDELIEEFEHNCKFCNSTFRNRYDLLEHNLVHLEIKSSVALFKCDLCPFYCDREFEIENHIITKHSIDNLSECDKHGNREVENNNNKVPVTKRIYTCSICDKSFKYNQWQGHMKQVHSNESIECDKCRGVFKCERYYKRHMLRAHSKNQGGDGKNVQQKIKEKVNCSKCSAVLSDKHAYKTHLRNCHSEAAQCDICDSVLASNSYLLTHMLRVHYNDGKKHRCNLCKKSFKSPRYLKIHKKNSHGRTK